jgi:hypothetical protein
VVIRNEKWILFIALAGCVVGNGVSYMVDPGNYQMGWGLMLWSTGTVSAVGSVGLHTWASLTLTRLPLLITIFLLLSYAFIRLVQIRGRLSVSQLIIFVFSGCLFGAYFFSAQIYAGIRYFAPVFITSISAAMLMFPQEHQSRQKSYYFFIYAIFLGFILVFYPKYPPYQVMPVSSRPGCIQILGVAQGYNHPNIDYIGDSIGSIERDIISENSGEPLCQP